MGPNSLLNYEFGRTLLCCLSPTCMFNKPASNLFCLCFNATSSSKTSARSTTGTSAASAARLVVACRRAAWKTRRAATMPQETATASRHQRYNTRFPETVSRVFDAPDEDVAVFVVGKC
jgi:hypothetical protein